MFCKNCGKNLSNTDKFCAACGQLVQSGSVTAIAKDMSEVATISAASNNPKKGVDHKKRLRGWSIFYIVFAVISAALPAFLGIATEASVFIWFMLPSLLMGILAYVMLRYRTKLAVGIFSTFYVLMFLAVMGISSATGGNGASIFLLIGFAGLFYCWRSASKLAKKTGSV